MNFNKFLPKALVGKKLICIGAVVLLLVVIYAFFIKRREGFTTAQDAQDTANSLMQNNYCRNNNSTYDSNTISCRCPSGAVSIQFDKADVDSLTDYYKIPVTSRNAQTKSLFDSLRNKFDKNKNDGTACQHLLNLDRIVVAKDQCKKFSAGATTWTAGDNISTCTISSPYTKCNLSYNFPKGQTYTDPFMQAYTNFFTERQACISTAAAAAAAAAAAQKYCRKGDAFSEKKCNDMKDCNGVNTKNGFANECTTKS